MAKKKKNNNNTLTFEKFKRVCRKYLYKKVPNTNLHNMYVDAKEDIKRGVSKSATDFILILYGGCLPDNHTNWLKSTQRAYDKHWRDVRSAKTTRLLRENNTNTGDWFNNDLDWAKCSDKNCIICKPDPIRAK